MRRSGGGDTRSFESTPASDLLKPADGYSDEFLSSCRRAPVVFLSRSQKDLWDKDVDYPDSTHSWAKRVKKELMYQAFTPKSQIPEDHGNFLMTMPPVEEAKRSRVVSTCNMSHLAYADQGLVAYDYDSAVKQQQNYGKRPGARDWTTSYNAMGEPKMQEKRKLFMGPTKKAQRIPSRSSSVMQGRFRPAAQPPASLQEDKDRTRAQRNDLEIKKMAATLKQDGLVVARSSSVEPLRPRPVVIGFDWKGYRLPAGSKKPQVARR